MATPTKRKRAAGQGDISAFFSPRPASASGSSITTAAVDLDAEDTDGGPDDWSWVESAVQRAEAARRAAGSEEHSDEGADPPNVITLDDDDEEEQEEITNATNRSAEARPKPAPTFASASSSSSAAAAGVPDLTASVFEYDASLPAYADPPWLPGGAAPYCHLVRCFETLSATRSRLAHMAILTNTFRHVLHHSPGDIVRAIYLCSNQIAPTYKGIELGLGGSIMSGAIRGISGKDAAWVKKAYDRLGDWGDIAYEARRSARPLVQPAPLKLQRLFESLHQICQMKGQRSTTSKTDMVRRLMVACRSAEEMKWLARILVQHLRTGAVKASVLIAVARAFVLHEQTRAEAPVSQEQTRADWALAEEQLKRSWAQLPNWDLLGADLLAHGWRGIDGRCKVAVGVPVRPMLGKITRDVSEVFEKHHGLEFVCDFKYDGQRAQIHRSEAGEVQIFSRHLENITDKYPDIVELVDAVIKAGGPALDAAVSFILDCEIVAVSEAGKILPFQTLATRARKNVAIADITVKVGVFAFDMLYFAGRSLLQCDLRERLATLHGKFPTLPPLFRFPEQIYTRDPEELDEYFAKAVDAGCEGLMIKVLDSPVVDDKATSTRKLVPIGTYEPDKRSDAWIKVKKDYTASGDSIDVVPIGAWWGQGRKTGFYSPFLLAVYNAENDTFETLCKCISGFTDEFYKEMKGFFTEASGTIQKVPDARYEVSSAMQPDLWFKPTVVWEIRGADITLSPVHQAGINDLPEDISQSGRGLSLRFPRFIRKREDKSIEEATSSAQIAEMFVAQRSDARTAAEPEEAED